MTRGTLQLACPALQGLLGRTHQDQYWVQSSGGCVVKRPPPHMGQGCEPWTLYSPALSSGVGAAVASAAPA